MRGGGNPDAPDDARRSESIEYGQVGEHVATVLRSADEAADRLRASAAAEADHIRADAEDYASKTRAAADAYAEERREDAETKAAAIISDAEQRARAVVEAARKEAAVIEQDAVHRRQSLLEESDRAEARLSNLLEVFRAITERLEHAVADAPDRAADAGAGAKRGPETDTHLADALMPYTGRAASQPEETEQRSSARRNFWGAARSPRPGGQSSTDR